MTFFLVIYNYLYIMESNGKLLTQVTFDESLNIDIIHQHQDCLLIGQEGALICS